MVFRLFYKSFNGPDPVHKIEYHKVPWLWIGAVYPDTTLDVTQTVDKSVHAGTRVDEEYLKSVTGETPITWKYLDEKTLEEKDFPSDGFIIGDYAETNNAEYRQTHSS